MEANTPKMLWSLDEKAQSETNLSHYQNWLKEHYNLSFDNYESLRKWSVDNVPIFWESLWQYFNIQSHTPYSQVLSADPMPRARWFEGATLNYVEHIFRNRKPDEIAIKFLAENVPLSNLTWSELENQVATIAEFLKSKGVQKGDCVVGYLPNITEAIVAFLATASLGAVWSSCSPDFGTNSVVERFKLIAPKVIFAVDGYRYNGKNFDRIETVNQITTELESLTDLVIVPYLTDFDEKNYDFDKKHDFRQILKQNTEGVLKLHFESIPFAHPLYVLYSSGTTGAPKAITHGHGGILLEHLKYLHLHNDVRPNETFFWYTTTGWMMWNFQISALLLGGSILLYDGSPTYPTVSKLWQLADAADVAHFGTSAPFLGACMKANFDARPYTSRLRSLNSTGSPLPPEAFGYVYEKIKSDIWLTSMSGGTDVCTAWVGANPLLPVYEGEIQCRCLGCDMHSFDDSAQPVIGEVGEMVVLKPMPSMPIYFGGDTDFSKYTDSYFDHFAGIWRHGDWLEITERGSLLIQGRSDATLNRHGIRIGTAEIYRVLDKISGIKDALIVNIEQSGGNHFMPLFVQLEEGFVLNDDLKKQIAKALREAYSPRHVPDEIVEVADIPYTISGKKMEAPVKKILMNYPLSKAANLGAMRNPQSLDFFVAFARLKI